MLKLYYAPGTVALAVHIALEETDAVYEAHRLNFPEGEQRTPAYLEVNPKGRVPALVTRRGILTETPAILAYIAQAYPIAELAPTDVFDFAVAQAFTNYLSSTVHVAHAHRMRGVRWADEESSLEDMKRKVPETMGAAVDLIENGMLKGPWVMGEQFTVCDPYLYTISRWLDGDGVPADRHPKVRDHMKRMEARPSVKAALEEQGLKPLT